jgi:Sulfotransferase domain
LVALWAFKRAMRGLYLRKYQQQVGRAYLEGAGVLQHILTLHVRHAGGTTVTTWLREQLGQRCTQLSVTQLANHTVICDNIPQAGCLYAHLMSGPTLDERVQFVQLVNKCGLQAEYVYGHMPVGMCRFSDSSCKYITLLREPVERTISHYYHMQRVHPELLQNLCANCSTIAGFANALAAASVAETALDNMQTRMIAGDGFVSSITGNRLCDAGLAGCDITPMGGLSWRMYVKAKRNILSKFSVIGVVEDIDSFMAAVSQVYGLLPPKTVHNVNVAASRANLPAPVRRQLAAALKYDLRLYSYVLSMVKEHSSIVAAWGSSGPS